MSDMDFFSRSPRQERGSQRVEYDGTFAAADVDDGRRDGFLQLPAEAVESRYRAAMAGQRVAFGRQASGGLSFDEQAGQDAVVCSGVQEPCMYLSLVCHSAASLVARASPIAAPPPTLFSLPLGSQGSQGNLGNAAAGVHVVMELVYLPRRQETVVRCLDLFVSLRWIDVMFCSSHDRQ
jgi:hypothetical protein